MSHGDTSRSGGAGAGYLREVLRGMGITFKHLARNLREPDGMPTVQYPEVRKAMPARYRGAHRLTTRPDGALKCVACMCCATACPSRCITIVAEELPGDPIEKGPARFEIDMLRCIFCGFCVEACPKDAIRMDTGIYEIHSETRRELVHSRDYMRDLADGERPPASRWYREHPESAPPGPGPRPPERDQGPGTRGGEGG